MSFFAQILPKKESKELFLTLALTDELVRAAIAQIEGSTITVIGTGQSQINQERTLPTAADMAITEAEQQLTEKSSVKQVVFALPAHYLKDDQVKPEYLETLKTISHELDLTPRGFIEYPSALSFYLEQEEGSPPTLLLIAIAGKRLTFTLMRLGKIQQQVELTPTDSFAADFSSALSQVSAEILPSRILLFDNGTSLESIRDELLKFSWHKYAQFLHTPKIEIFPIQKILTVLVEAGASSFLRKLPHAHEVPPAALETPPGVPPADTPSVEQERTVMVTETEHHPKHTHHAQHAMEQQQPLPDPAETEEETLSTGRRFRLPANPFPNGLPRLPFLSGGFFLLLPLLIAAAGIGFLYWYVPKSTVLLIVYPFSASQRTSVRFSTTTDQSSADSPTILVREVSKEVQGELAAATTGKGNTGEKAKGEVTVYNKTTTGKTLPKGTVLLHGDLRFTLDSDVGLASASDTGEGLAFGKTAVNVTAGSIGPQSNIPPGSTFTFKDFPEISYGAKNTNGFAGGTSREVTSVSKEDQTKLEEQLMQQLLAQSRQEITQTLSSGEQLIDETLETEVTSKKFSHDVGSEAKEVTLTLSIRATIRAYQKEELSQLAQTTFPSPPGDFLKSPRTVTAAVEKITTEKNGTNNADVRITAYFLPAVDTEAIRQQLAGKSFDQAKAYAGELANIGGIRILHRQMLPGVLKRLPFRKDNIIVETVVY